MHHMDNLRERVDVLEEHARKVERRVRWWRGIACSVVVLLIFAPGQLWALPETAVDFSGPAPGIGSVVEIDNQTPATILRAVNIVCPNAGFVVAIANGGLEYTRLVADRTGAVFISLTRDSVNLDVNHQLRIIGEHLTDKTPFPTGGIGNPVLGVGEIGGPNFVNGLYSGTVSIQRVDRCRSGGDTHTYRFLAVGTGTTADASMRQPSVILMFFVDRF